MKIFIALCLVVAVAIAEDEWKVKSKEELMKIHVECYKENNLTEDQVAKIMNYEYDDEPSVRCSLKCAAEKCQVWNPTNGYNVDRLYEQLTAKGEVITSKEDLQKCIDPKKEDEDDCQWAFRGLKCMLGNKYITKTD